MARSLRPIAQQPLAEVVGKLAAQTPAPGGGTAAAIAVALAAALVEMSSAFDTSISARARGVRAESLRARALELADVDLDAYGPVLEALRMPDESPQREQRLAASLAAAAGPPLTIAGIGSQVAALAAESATQGSPHLVGDAVVAAELADGATRAAAHLVRLNLAESPGDPRRTEVTGLVNAAAEALEQAFAVAAGR